MTKAGLIDILAEQAGLPWTKAEAVVEGIFGRMADALAKGDKVELRGFGTGRIRHRRARDGRNPKTGTPVKVPPKRAVLFRPAKALRSAIEALDQRAQLPKREP